MNKNNNVKFYSFFVGKDLMFAVGLRRGGVLDWKEDETVGVGKDLMFAVGLRR